MEKEFRIMEMELRKISVTPVKDTTLPLSATNSSMTTIQFISRIATLTPTLTLTKIYRKLNLIQKEESYAPGRHFAKLWQESIVKF